MTEQATFRAVKVGAMVIRNRYLDKVRIWGRGAGDTYLVTPASYRTDRQTWLMTEDQFAGPPVTVTL